MITRARNPVCHFKFHHGNVAEPLELHSPLMHGVSHMEWKPFSGSILAVACQYGTLIWNGMGWRTRYLSAPPKT
jgi:hypothetical protein